MVGGTTSILSLLMNFEPLCSQLGIAVRGHPLALRQIEGRLEDLHVQVVTSARRAVTLVLNRSRKELEEVLCDSGA
jgi:hypothetical protein